MGIRVYVSNVTFSRDVKAHQQKVEMILSSKKIDVQYIDIGEREEDKEFIREKAGSIITPQFFNDEEYLGDFKKFDDAVEEERLMEFLKLQ